MQQPTRYYISKRGEESTVRSVRVEKHPAASVATDEERGSHLADESVTESCEQRRSVLDKVQGALHKRQFFS